jgi:DNA-binding transcriptional LysR family regulator
VRFADAWGHGLATTRLPSPVRAVIAKLVGRRPGEDIVPAIECDDLGLLRTLALSTDTVVATSGAAVRDELRAGALVRLDVTDLPPVYAEMGVVALVNRTPSPMAQRAIACIREIARDIDAAAPGS